MEHIPFSTLATHNYGWLDTRYHFSFANYYDPSNMGVGALRVVNDDIIAPEKGFDTHPHTDMEIVTYVLDGTLTHADSMGHTRELSRYGIQYMSAGTGIYHSEYNHHKSPLRLIQSWIVPDKQGHTPAYGDIVPDPVLFRNQWLTIVSGNQGDGLIKINQGADILIGEFFGSQTIELGLEGKKQFYIVNLEGESDINKQRLVHGDALKCGEDLKVQVKEHAHMLVFRLG